jgi:hypothetical protein
MVVECRGGCYKGAARFVAEAVIVVVFRGSLGRLCRNGNSRNSSVRICVGRQCS